MVIAKNLDENNLEWPVPISFSLQVAPGGGKCPSKVSVSI